MTSQLHAEIEKLKGHLLSLCGAVEAQTEKAVKALLDRNAGLAREVVPRDQDIDRREVEVEEECVRVLVLYQPVANDLRFVVSALKINNDLERIGDLAVNIAHKAIALADSPVEEFPVDVTAMWAKTQHMLRDSLDAMVKMDVDLARDVCLRDDEVDRMKREARETIESLVSQDPEANRCLLRLMAACRNLERIADLATNIAEDVIYLAEGRIIRHSVEDEAAL
jgi:phosphate transport system protein